MKTKLFSMLLLAAMILGFSACEKDKNPVGSTTSDGKGTGSFDVILMTNDLIGAEASLNLTSGIVFSDLVILTVKPESEAIWTSVPTAVATNALLKEKTNDGDVYKFTFTAFENNSVITVKGVATDASSENVHEYVDLGLSVMWATCNVGATKPEEYGNYFAWGETQPKSTYDWSFYKYGSDYDELTKYCTDSRYGTVDNKTTLELADDAAQANWGGNWRMPTIDEQKELLNNCTWTWTTKNGVNGYIVTGKNGNTIFLPAAGYRTNSNLNYAGEYGIYWGSSLYSYYPNNAYYLNFFSDYLDWYSNDRYYGLSVRAVCSSR